MQAKARRLQCAIQLQETTTVFQGRRDFIGKFFSAFQESKEQVHPRSEWEHHLGSLVSSSSGVGLMKQLCLLAAGNPDAGRDNSGKKIDGLTWISPEWALRMFNLLVAGFFVKARNDDEKKIDGSSNFGQLCRDARSSQE